MTTRALRIHGRVQGVGYRAWAAGQAERLGLSGWVRNEPDGTVSALVEGAPASIEAMIDACREGPYAARVTRVDAQDAAPEGAAGFRILG
ncbi:acylphosphatase [Limibaculum sp. M0105]|uniref:acylphosphatase n=1 Tax=Thermohalobaculum xanthum TaxID=2753746 RepID=A0A8J7M5P0_9RHOB|nr:acylphosphatase [Thermohalobaculum xanthum]MBK0398160.1 acylphosphatase [Thermohalobaculum xanthum]